MNEFLDLQAEETYKKVVEINEAFRDLVEQEKKCKDLVDKFYSDLNL
jgi:hypothetical protein